MTFNIKVVSVYTDCRLGLIVGLRGVQFLGLTCSMCMCGWWGAGQRGGQLQDEQPGQQPLHPQHLGQHGQPEQQRQQHAGGAGSRQLLRHDHDAPPGLQQHPGILPAHQEGKGRSGWLDARDGGGGGW